MALLVALIIVVKLDSEPTLIQSSMVVKTGADCSERDDEFRRRCVLVSVTWVLAQALRLSYHSGDL